MRLEGHRCLWVTAGLQTSYFSQGSLARSISFLESAVAVLAERVPREQARALPVDLESALSKLITAQLARRVTSESRLAS